ncbi:MAG: F0F1 ATP synthase subunit B [Burkholderiaceae bacterium]|nr:F0F1 ATP synthase subunit B [Burkholderiaceae bacterium]MEB2352920.1 F0F1 ATP synthase subunit B [Burkholderiaceae bacterium]
MNLNATLIVQIIVFLALWWFTARFVWPPITRALDDRSRRIADGLAAADKARSDLAAAERRVEQELQQARAGAAEVRSGAEKQAAGIVEKARVEAAAIIAAARKSAEDEAVLAAQKARDQLRDQVAVLAVAGAERILRQEVDAAKHADLLANLKNELN